MVAFAHYGLIFECQRSKKCWLRFGSFSLKIVSWLKDKKIILELKKIDRLVV